MLIKQISEEIAVSQQVQPDDIITISKAGFKSIICNRPDGEVPEQPEFDDIRQQAEVYGIKGYYFPVTSGQISDEQVREFEDLLQDAPKPVLAWCRTGTRSISLWALSQVNNISHEALLRQAKQAGYDLTGVVNRLGT